MNPFNGTRFRPEHCATVVRIGRLLVAAFLFTGCTHPSIRPSVPPAVREPVALASGDTLKFSFAGTPEFDQTQKIRPDGRVSLPLIGEVVAEGKPLPALQAELSHRYELQLQNNTVSVVLEHTSATAYVTGAVMKPGKISIDRPMTALEAILEAGGFDPDFANTRKVLVLRNENGQQSSHTLNLRPALQGKPYTAFYLKPRDVIFVPQSLF